MIPTYRQSFGDNMAGITQYRHSFVHMATSFGIDSRSLRIIHDQDTQLHSGYLSFCFFALFMVAMGHGPHWRGIKVNEHGVDLVALGGVLEGRRSSHMSINFDCI
jgi:hypothetical protein